MTSSRARTRRVPLAVLVIAGLVILGLMILAGRYGFHRDEYYFVVTGQHPAVAAPDNPMLVSYLAAGWYAVVGGQLWAFRILPAGRTATDGWLRGSGSSWC